MSEDLGATGVWGFRRLLQSIAITLATSLAIFFIVSAIWGAADSYSPIPYGDMWEGYIRFFVDWRDGWQSWWRPHNEHRIVFGKLLFWIDLTFFHGSIIFLIVVNFVLVAASALLFLSMAKQMPAAEQYPALGWIIGLACTCLLFSWTQSENISWGFQGVFFLAQLLPLFAFYLLYRSYVAQQHTVRLFVAAATLGFMCIGTMANGVLVLPLMAVLALILRLGKFRIAILAVLAVAALFFYFSGIPPVKNRGLVLGALVGQPFALLHYVVLYLGSPFYYVSIPESLLAAQLAGGIFLTGAACFFIRACSAPAANALSLALLLFVAFIVATALITGSGRLLFGVEQAISSRYTTTALMGWCALLLVSANFLQRTAIGGGMVGAVALLMVLLLLPRQLIIFQMPNPYPFERLVAGLALEMGVRDDKTIRGISPRGERILNLVGIARQRELSVFGRPLLKGLRERIDRDIVALPAAHCQAFIDAVDVVPGDDRYLAIEGWIYQPDAKAAPHAVLLVDSTGRLVGYGFSGKSRVDVAQALHIRDHNTGFRGYLLSSYQGARIFLVGEELACQWEGVVPTAPGSSAG